jgi:superfamily I DNA/RNA helicase
MQSNIQPIKIYPTGSRVKYDVDFLAQIHDYKALNKLRFLLSSTGAMNTSDYIYKYYQSSIVNNTGYGGFRNRDQCWGPVKNAHGRIELLHKPLITEEELKYFDPADESAVTEYGYKEFLAQGAPYDLVINSECSSSYDYTHDNSAFGDKVTIDLIKAAKKEIKTISITPPTDVVPQPTSIPELGNIFDLFLESTQEEIIAASSEDVIFVDAGPGTGKTHTLIHRINHLVTIDGVDPEGILVLCFTNAAVDEIRNRLTAFVDSGADRGLANVDVRTFHSFAWWLIGQANELFVDEGWTKVNMASLNYDTSIKVATKIINKYHDTIVGNWEHFIVDEVQDLTNSLARFVLYIVSACLKNNCGFTVLGDACQAIYDYTQDYSLDAMKSEEFYRALTNQIRTKARFLKLVKNHRQNQILINATHRLREAILSQEHAQMETATDAMLGELPKLNKTSVTIRLDDIEEYIKKGKVCLLLRNNGQTLRTSSNLRKRGIKHTLNCSTTDRNFASWIADVFFDYNSKYITYDEFKKRIESAPGMQFAAKEIWSKLCKVAHTDCDDLKVRDILDGVLYSKIDDEFLRYRNNETLVVSNIHRAKGREYECVILDQDFAQSMLDEKSNADEYKTLYVGVTRPKNHLYVAPLQKRGELQYIHIFDSDRHRWGKTKKRQISHLEFNSNIDLTITDFASVPINNFRNVCVDDEVALVRKIKNGKIDYDIIHETTGTVIGKINDAYVDDLMHYMQLSDDEMYEMPERISDLYVSGVYTQIVDEDYLAANPNISQITPNGVWKWVEIVGVGHAQYGVY